MTDLTLKTNFLDGDIFYAGTPSDTDKLNGITGQVNANTTKIVDLDSPKEDYLDVSSSKLYQVTGNLKVRTVPANTFKHYMVIEIVGNIGPPSVGTYTMVLRVGGTIKVTKTNDGDVYSSWGINKIILASDPDWNPTANCEVRLDVTENYQTSLHCGMMHIYGV